MSGVRLHDYGCTLKAYRREVLEPNALYGEMHRFIPIYASWAGARVTEMVVTHHPRVAGQSKYGLGRVYKVMLDLLTVSFLGGYSTKPIYFFGKPALALCWHRVASRDSIFVAQFIKDHVLNHPGTWIQGSTLLLAHRVHVHARRAAAADGAARRGADAHVLRVAEEEDVPGARAGELRGAAAAPPGCREPRARCRELRGRAMCGIAGQVARDGASVDEGCPPRG